MVPHEMMMTIQETEKICDLIEEKDRVRKEKEDKEALKKQLELNRKFLIQQKAQDKQIKDLKMFVNQWNSNKKNLVLITHYSIITAVTDAVPSSGEIVVTDKNFRVIGTIRTD